MANTDPLVLEDLAAQFDKNERKAHSDVLCARLVERWPDTYTGWTPATLAAALKPYGVSTQQTWAPCLDGLPSNHMGIHRAALASAVTPKLCTEAKANTSVVYFVERDGFIKIGTTTHLVARLKALSKGGSMPEGMTVGPVRLLVVTPGDRNIESWMHERFREYRLPSTEWFYPSSGLLDFIHWLKRQTPAEPDPEM